MRARNLWLRTLGSALSAGGGEAEPLEDPSRMMRREIGAVETGCASQYLLRGEAAAADDDVVLLDWIRQDTLDGTLDRTLVELEPPPGDLEGRNLCIVFSGLSLRECLFWTTDLG